MIDKDKYEQIVMFYIYTAIADEAETVRKVTVAG